MLGLLATGAGLAAAELVVGLVQGSSSPVVPVGQVFIDLVPKPLKNWAIETFGTNDKAVLVAGALIVVLGVGVTVGILAMRGARAAAYALTSAIGLLGSFAVLTRPDPTLAKLLPTIVGTGVSIAVLWYLAPRPAERSCRIRCTACPTDHGDRPSPIRRRGDRDRLGGSARRWCGPHAATALRRER